MFSRPIERRFYSLKTVSKLWVKHNESPSLNVSLKGCINIDDFVQKVKKKSNVNCQVGLFTSFDKELVSPGLKIKEFLKMDAVKNNSKESPLFIKVFPAAQVSIPVPTKTIYIGKTDKHGECMGEYIKVKLRNDHDLMTIIGDSNGLINQSCLDTVLIHFDDIKDGEKYYFYRIGQNKLSWRKSDAMEADAFISMKTFLMEKENLLVSSIDLSTDVYDEMKMEEWDGFFMAITDDTLFLLGARRSMSIFKLMILADRVKKLKLSGGKGGMINGRDKKIVGVACGTRFPPACRKEAYRLGLVVLYQSSYRLVDDKIIYNFAIEKRN